MPCSTCFRSRKYRRVPLPSHMASSLADSASHHSCTHTLVIIYPFKFATVEIDFGEGCFRLDTHALPDPLENESKLLKAHGRREGAELPTRGLKLVNSRPLQSTVMKGANCPFASAVYGCGGLDASNLAELSRLQRPHFQTKWAVFPFPELTWCSS